MTNNKISDNYKYTLILIQGPQNQKQTITGLANFFKVKIGAKVMLKVSIDIKDRLISGQTGFIGHVEYAQGIVFKVYVKFSDEKAGLKAMRSSY